MEMRSQRLAEGLYTNPFRPINPRSQQLASALIECYRLMRERETKGSRILFDAVNEAFSYLRD